MQPQATETHSNLAGLAGPGGLSKLVARSPVLQFLRRNWLEILLPGAVGAALWAAFNYR